jgi:hypothetical protein
VHSVWTDSAAQKAFYILGSKLSTHIHLVLRSRMVEIYLHSLIRFHGVVLDYLSAGRALSLTELCMHFSSLPFTAILISLDFIILIIFGE